MSVENNVTRNLLQQQPGRVLFGNPNFDSIDEVVKFDSRSSMMPSAARLGAYLLSLYAMTFVGCDKKSSISPLSPSGPSILRDRDGRYILVNERFFSYDGSFSVFLERIYLDVTNLYMSFSNPNSEKWLFLCHGIIDDPSTEGPGRPSTIFPGISGYRPSGSGVSSGQNGFYGGRSDVRENIPYLRLSGFYLPSMSSFVNCNNKPDFVLDLPLGRLGF